MRDGPKPDERYSHPDIVTDEALDWFLRLQDERDDPAVSAEFDRWLASDPRHREAFARLQRMRSMPSLRRATERDAARLGMTTRNRAGQIIPIRARSRAWSVRIAAIAAAAVLLIGVQQYPALMLRWQADFLTAAGELRRVRLPDGSDMILNTASAVALDFEQGHRRVRLLAGEAFFDVRADAAKPFTVVGSFSEVEVKGTAFAVREDSDRDVVVLERGLVDVRRLSAPADHVGLKPNEMVTASATAISTVTSVDPNNSLAWRDGRIVISDQPFNKALGELRRYYSGSVIVATSRFSETSVSGNYRTGDPQAAIRTLAESAGASVTRLPGGILILR
ncbi:FecR family protein [Bradyrhizobium sp. USDA 10063]